MIFTIISRQPDIHFDFGKNKGLVDSEANTSLGLNEFISQNFLPISVNTDNKISLVKPFGVKIPESKQSSENEHEYEAKTMNDTKVWPQTRRYSKLSEGGLYDVSQLFNSKYSEICFAVEFSGLKR